MVLFFAHIPFVVKLAFSAAPAESWQQFQICCFYLKYSWEFPVAYSR